MTLNDYKEFKIRTVHDVDEYRSINVYGGRIYPMRKEKRGLTLTGAVMLLAISTAMLLATICEVRGAL